MPPTATEEAPAEPVAASKTPKPAAPARNTLTAPLALPATSPLLAHAHHDATPTIGTEFSSSLQLATLVPSEGTPAPPQLRDLAALVSQRGVVFFRAQTITIAQQQLLGAALGAASGKPATSGLHTHPLTRPQSELGDRVSVISSRERAAFDNALHESAGLWNPDERTKLASGGWHADISFEPVPSDYALLKIHTQPVTGGDTLWASGYEVYDRLSPALRALLLPLPAVHDATRFNRQAAARGFRVRAEQRGAPENVGEVLTAVHPVVRTNPVTGWRSVYVNRGFTKRILGVTKDESDMLIDYLTRLVDANHDLQVRFRWGRYDQPGVGDVAIWDNRSTYHTATDDYQEDGGVRQGDRVVSLGERPFGGPDVGVSRREALGLPVPGGQQF